MFPQNYFSDLDKFKNEPYNCKINTKNNLFMINYGKTLKNYTELSKLNGIIVEKDTEKIIYYGLDKMNKDFNEFLNNNEQFNVFELVDGPKIGLYYNNDKWNKCTNKKIYASESIWHGPNFDVLSEKCFEKLDFERLNKDYCYTFVIQNPACMNYIKYETDDLRLISVRDLNPSSETYLKEVSHDIGVSIPKQHSFIPKTIDHVKEEIKSNLESEEIKQMPGYIIKTPSQTFRLESNNYLECVKVKGNERNLKFRYLQIRTDFVLKNKFLIYFPELINMTNNIEYQIRNTVGNILDNYLKRYVQKIPNYEINPRYKNIIYVIHGMYLKDKQKITFEKVLELLNNSDTKRIMYLLNTVFNQKNVNLITN
jgi:hypothetical protein